jgi:hypothetical protein
MKPGIPELVIALVITSAMKKVGTSFDDCPKPSLQNRGYLRSDMLSHVTVRAPILHYLRCLCLLMSVEGDRRCASRRIL